MSWLQLVQATHLTLLLNIASLTLSTPPECRTIITEDSLVASGHPQYAPSQTPAHCTERFWLQLVQATHLTLLLNIAGLTLSTPPECRTIITEDSLVASGHPQYAPSQTPAHCTERFWLQLVQATHLTLLLNIASLTLSTPPECRAIITEDSLVASGHPQYATSQTPAHCTERFWLQLVQATHLTLLLNIASLTLSTPPECRAIITEDSSLVASGHPQYAPSQTPAHCTERFWLQLVQATHLTLLLNIASLTLSTPPECRTIITEDSLVASGHPQYATSQTPAHCTERFWLQLVQATHLTLLLNIANLTLSTPPECRAIITEDSSLVASGHPQYATSQTPAHCTERFWLQLVQATHLTLLLNIASLTLSTPPECRAIITEDSLVASGHPQYAPSQTPAHCTERFWLQLVQATHLTLLLNIASLTLSTPPECRTIITEDSLVASGHPQYAPSQTPAHCTEWLQLVQATHLTLLLNIAGLTLATPPECRAIITEDSLVASGHPQYATSQTPAHCTERFWLQLVQATHLTLLLNIASLTLSTPPECRTIITEDSLVASGHPQYATSQTPAHCTERFWLQLVQATHLTLLLNIASLTLSTPPECRTIITEDSLVASGHPQYATSQTPAHCTERFWLQLVKATHLTLLLNIASLTLSTPPECRTIITEDSLVASGHPQYATSQTPAHCTERFWLQLVQATHLTLLLNIASLTLSTPPECRAIITEDSLVASGHPQYATSQTPAHCTERFWLQLVQATHLTLLLNIASLTLSTPPECRAIITEDSLVASGHPQYAPSQTPAHCTERFWLQLVQVTHLTLLLNIASLTLSTPPECRTIITEDSLVASGHPQYATSQTPAHCTERFWLQLVQATHLTLLLNIASLTLSTPPECRTIITEDSLVASGHPQYATSQTPAHCTECFWLQLVQATHLTLLLNIASLTLSTPPECRTIITEDSLVASGHPQYATSQTPAHCTERFWLQLVQATHLTLLLNIASLTLSTPPECRTIITEDSLVASGHPQYATSQTPAHCTERFWLQLVQATHLTLLLNIASLTLSTPPECRTIITEDSLVASGHPQYATSQTPAHCTERFWLQLVQATHLTLLLNIASLTLSTPPECRTIITEDSLVASGHPQYATSQTPAHCTERFWLQLVQATHLTLLLNIASLTLSTPPECRTIITEDSLVASGHPQYATSQTPAHCTERFWLQLVQATHLTLLLNIASLTLSTPPECRAIITEDSLVASGHPQYAPSQTPAHCTERFWLQLVQATHLTLLLNIASLTLSTPPECRAIITEDSSLVASGHPQYATSQTPAHCTERFWLQLVQAIHLTLLLNIASLTLSTPPECRAIITEDSLVASGHPQYAPSQTPAHCTERFWLQLVQATHLTLLLNIASLTLSTPPECRAIITEDSSLVASGHPQYATSQTPAHCTERVWLQLVQATHLTLLLNIASLTLSTPPECRAIITEDSLVASGHPQYAPSQTPAHCTERFWLQLVQATHLTLLLNIAGLTLSTPPECRAIITEDSSLLASGHPQYATSQTPAHCTERFWLQLVQATHLTLLLNIAGLTLSTPPECRAIITEDSSLVASGHPQYATSQTPAHCTERFWLQLVQATHLTLLLNIASLTLSTPPECRAIITEDSLVASGHPQYAPSQTPAHCTERFWLQLVQATHLTLLLNIASLTLATPPECRAIITEDSSLVASGHPQYATSQTPAHCTEWLQLVQATHLTLLLNIAGLTLSTPPECRAIITEDSLVASGHPQYATSQTPAHCTERFWLQLVQATHLTLLLNIAGLTLSTPPECRAIITEDSLVASGHPQYATSQTPAHCTERFWLQLVQATHLTLLLNIASLTLSTPPECRAIITEDSLVASGHPQYATSQTPAHCTERFWLQLVQATHLTLLLNIAGLTLSTPPECRAIITEDSLVASGHPQYATSQTPAHCTERFWLQLVQATHLTLLLNIASLTLSTPPECRAIITEDSLVASGHPQYATSQTPAHCTERFWLQLVQATHLTLLLNIAGLTLSTPPECRAIITEDSLVASGHPQYATSQTPAHCTERFWLQLVQATHLTLLLNIAGLTLSTPPECRAIITEDSLVASGHPQYAPSQTPAHCTERFWLQLVQATHLTLLLNIASLTLSTPPECRAIITEDSLVASGHPQYATSQTPAHCTEWLQLVQATHLTLLLNIAGLTLSTPPECRAIITEDSLVASGHPQYATSQTPAHCTERFWLQLVQATHLTLLLNIAGLTLSTPPECRAIITEDSSLVASGHPQYATSQTPAHCTEWLQLVQATHLTLLLNIAGLTLSTPPECRAIITEDSLVASGHPQYATSQTPAHCTERFWLQLVQATHLTLLLNIAGLTLSTPPECRAIITEDSLVASGHPQYATSQTPAHCTEWLQLVQATHLTLLLNIAGLTLSTPPECRAIITEDSLVASGHPQYATSQTPAHCTERFWLQLVQATHLTLLLNIASLTLATPPECRAIITEDSLVASGHPQYATSQTPAHCTERFWLQLVQATHLTLLLNIAGLTLSTPPECRAIITEDSLVASGHPQYATSQTPAHCTEWLQLVQATHLTLLLNIASLTLSTPPECRAIITEDSLVASGHPQYATSQTPAHCTERFWLQLVQATHLTLLLNIAGLTLSTPPECRAIITEDSLVASGHPQYATSQTPAHCTERFWLQLVQATHLTLLLNIAGLTLSTPPECRAIITEDSLVASGHPQYATSQTPAHCTERFWLQLVQATHLTLLLNIAGLTLSTPPECRAIITEDSSLVASGHPQYATSQTPAHCTERFWLQLVQATHLTLLLNIAGLTLSTPPECRAIITEDSLVASGHPQYAPSQTPAHCTERFWLQLVQATHLTLLLNIASLTLSTPPECRAIITEDSLVASGHPQYATSQTPAHCTERFWLQLVQATHLTLLLNIAGLTLSTPPECRAIITEDSLVASGHPQYATSQTPAHCTERFWLQLVQATHLTLLLNIAGLTLSTPTECRAIITEDSLVASGHPQYATSQTPAHCTEWLQLVQATHLTLLLNIAGLTLSTPPECRAIITEDSSLVASGHPQYATSQTPAHCTERFWLQLVQATHLTLLLNIAGLTLSTPPECRAIITEDSLVASGHPQYATSQTPAHCTERFWLQLVQATHLTLLLNIAGLTLSTPPECRTIITEDSLVASGHPQYATSQTPAHCTERFWLQLVQATHLTLLLNIAGLTLSTPPECRAIITEDSLVASGHPQYATSQTPAHCTERFWLQLVQATHLTLLLNIASLTLATPPECRTIITEDSLVASGHPQYATSQTPAHCTERFWLQLVQATHLTLLLNIASLTLSTPPECRAIITEDSLVASGHPQYAPSQTPAHCTERFWLVSSGYTPDTITKHSKPYFVHTTWM